MIEFKKKLNGYQSRVNQFLTHYLNSLSKGSPQLIEAVRYATLSEGKRIRPYLVYATGELLHIPLHNLDPAAAAIECIHAYSLIHDDLPAMDNDTLRRGLPTCHIKYGEATAILAGDALQSLAFSLLADSDMPDVAPKNRLAMISELANASGISGMCSGQQMDLEAEYHTVSLKQLETIHQNKTGALIRAAMRLAVLSANQQNNNITVILDNFAKAIGLAFQIQDDILDVIGEPDKTGKTKGSDKVHGKNTYSTLLGVEKAKEKALYFCNDAHLSLSMLSSMHYDTTALNALTNFIIKRDN